MADAAPPTAARSVRSLPREAIPDVIGGMLVTDDLLRAYAGHESLLAMRAKHPSEECRRGYDALRMCLLQRADIETCANVFKAYEPCGRELKAARARRAAEAAEKRRALKLPAGAGQ
jgi:hypothetical protein